MAESVETHVCARLMQRDIDIKNYIRKSNNWVDQQANTIPLLTFAILIGLEEMLPRLHRYTLPSPSRYQLRQLLL